MPAGVSSAANQLEQVQQELDLERVLILSKQIPIGSRLKLMLHLTGGGDEVESQPYGDDDFMATQAFGDDDYEQPDDAHGVLIRLEDGQPAGVAANLPGVVGVDVLALGRDVQQLTRTVVEGETLGVLTVRLVDEALGLRPVVSGLQADIAYDMSGNLIFTSLGQSFNFINESPVHRSSNTCPRQIRLYDQDVIRLGGNPTGRPGGGYSAFVFRVEHAPLGARPLATAAETTKPADPKPPTAAPSASEGTDGGAAERPRLETVRGGGAAIVLSTAAKARTYLDGAAGPHVPS